MNRKPHTVEILAAIINDEGIKSFLQNSIPNRVRRVQVETVWTNNGFCAAFGSMSSKERNATINYIRKVYSEKGSDWLDQSLGM